MSVYDYTRYRVLGLCQSAKPVISSAPNTALMLKTPPVNELIAEP